MKPALPVIGSRWADPAGLYAGLIHTPEGLHHVVLVDELPKKAEMNWSAAMKWAKGIGADLPSRQEALALFKHLPGEFERDWHWTNEQFSAEGYAWVQRFGYGYQSLDGESYERRVRAVRRFPLDPSILQPQPGQLTAEVLAEARKLLDIHDGLAAHVAGLRELIGKAAS